MGSSHKCIGQRGACVQGVFGKLACTLQQGPAIEHGVN